MKASSSGTFTCLCCGVTYRNIHQSTAPIGMQDQFCSTLCCMTPMIQEPTPPAPLTPTLPPTPHFSVDFCMALQRALEERPDEVIATAQRLGAKEAEVTGAK